MMTSFMRKHLGADKVSIGSEFVAAMGTYMTMSYIFILNPVLLAKAHVDISQAFAGTIISAALATLCMAFYAKLPFAVAPAPSITTFFVSFVVIKEGLPWQAAMFAVIVSGIISVALALSSVRLKLVDSIPDGLRVALLFALGGFLVANGFVQSKVLIFASGSPALGTGLAGYGIMGGLIVLAAGFGITQLLRRPFFHFSAAPIVGILVASVICLGMGITQPSKVQLSWDMISVPLDLTSWLLSGGMQELATSSAWTSILVFVIIDFFGGIGKFVGLFASIDTGENKIDKEKFKKALNVDGMGSIVGGAIGAGSLAVFVSSAVGIKAGGRTGLTSVFIALFIAASFVFIPLVGSIPPEATSGILIYVGLLLVPITAIYKGDIKLDRIDIALCLLAMAIGFWTFALDRAMLILFMAYTIKMIVERKGQGAWILGGTASALIAALVAQNI